VDKREATTRPLAEVRAQIADQIAYERAQQQGSALAETLRKEIRSAADLDKAAAAHGLKVQESGFFTKDEPIASIGPAPDVSEQAFETKDGTVAGPIRTPRGEVFLTPTGKQDARIPALSEVTDKVRDDAVREKARDVSRERALALAERFKTDFAGAAKAAGLEVKTTELVARGSTLPEVGLSPAVDAAVFALPQGGVTAPVVTDNGTVVARVVEKSEVTPEELATAKNGLREEMLNERRGRFFSAYMQKAREKMKTAINEDLVKQVAS
jgi:parvulin-like peptidyl-prolyl isomerase